MSRFVCYIPSFNDSDYVRESLASLPEWDVVISDNASAEPHRSVLDSFASDRVRIVRHQKSLGRVGNWKSCVEHFVDSGYEWMKFLCAGDVHLPDSLNVYRRALEKFPMARYVVPQIDNVSEQGRHRWGLTDDYVLATPIQAMMLVVRHGNVFHGLIAPLIHVDLLRDGFQFGEDNLSFCADMLFLMNIAKKTDTLYVPEPVAEFIMTRRKTLAVKLHTLEHYLEEGLLRLRAADTFFAMTGDQPYRNELIAVALDWLRKGLNQPLQKLTGEIPPLPTKPANQG
jgi:glycosyltransferase involved in cell wall biosynthesis